MTSTPALVVAVALSLTACGRDAPVDTSAGRSPSTAPTVAPGIDEALIKDDDLGAEWAGTPPQDVLDVRRPRDPDAVPCDVQGAEVGEIVARRTEMSHAERGAFVTHDVVQYRQGYARPALAAARDTYARCASFRDFEERSISLDAAPYRDAPALGDESAAARLTTTVDGRRLAGAVFTIREGSFLSVVIALAPEDGQRFALSVARRAAEKMARLD